MIRISKKTNAVVSRNPRRAESGQALVEFAAVIVMLIALVYGLMDFCVAIYEKQLLTNLSREGANLSARGVGATQAEIMSNALHAVWVESSPLNLSNSTSGRLILTAASNTNKTYGGYLVTQQLDSGSMSASSVVAPGGINKAANIPTNLIVAAGHTIYIAEVFYDYTPPAPLVKLVHINLTNRFYDVAYFPGG